MNYIVLLFTLFLVTLCAGQSSRQFSANYVAKETYTVGTATLERDFAGKIYYDSRWTFANPVNYEAIRLDIDLGQTLLDNTTLTELSIYQDQFIKYTICRGSCAWQDIFAEEPFPKLYFLNSDVPSGNQVLTVGSTQVNAECYDFDQFNVVNQSYPNFVEACFHPTTDLILKATINYQNGVQRVLTFGGHDLNFDADAAFAVPSFCPVITTGCLRLDIIFVVDTSGSVGSMGITQAFDFLHDVSVPLYIDPKYIGVGLVTFSYCSNARIRQRLLYNKATWLAALTTIRSQTVSDGYTCIVGGMQRGMWLLTPVNGSRLATPDCLITITDGYGNRPCSGRTVFQYPDEDCANVTGFPSPAPCCSTCVNKYNCNDGACCRSLHDYNLVLFHLFFTLALVPTPRLYAIGVGPGISRATLNLIVNDVLGASIARTNVFQVASYAQLNTIIASLVAALLCNNPGSETCPNDCRPGGFCCAGGCLCSVDCTIQSTDCQTGYCRVNNQGADCVLGNPNDAACQSLAFDKQCKNWFCVANSGCDFTINDNLFCTDNNLCTNETCTNGTCVPIKNNVTQCDDRNECTINDQCTPTGACVGSPNDFVATCDDGDLCTNNTCSGDQCVVSASTTCVDDDTSDCVVYKCDPTTGLCLPTPVKPGFTCRPSPPGDNCTVYICDKFDPEDFQACIDEGNEVTDCSRGECLERTRDIDECKGSSDNIGPIVGGVIAGVAFLAIIAIIIAVFLLILLRNKIPSILGGINPFAPGSNVVTPGTYEGSETSGQSALFEGGGQ